ncbi:serine/threonine-protein kinase [Tahibacter amnicola]|uniref:Serine/threonine-protein kinase n=1 Tax=Tahibacter amnicola TaxID=2976241 RepID=A0ABY6BL48_9GAMM|nr:serine/threonine-protein kinase [Tahibacter amnicola]UXI70153.1 serine/threonine-protein kinase [Tahibacter amnicola]
MDAQRWRRARELFDALADAPAERWNDRLEQLCPDDDAVRAEALALLRADQDVTLTTALAGHAPDLIEAAAQDHDREERVALAGVRVGPFRLVRELGRGGMGQVWLAERDDGEFQQSVAIKLMRGGWDTDELHARFRAERQILAGLTHPNIAHLVDGGVTANGKPWLALEYVDGSNLREYCDARRLSLRERLRLFLTVCDAVAHAHARLVVHRDLKPSNLLVDSRGQAKLLDFGIAKLIDSDTATSTTRIFTPEYAAPEQVRGELVTTAVDIYALGLLLYELLTGCRPYQLKDSTPAAYERAILDQEPTRPSAAVTRSDAEADARAAQRHLTPGLLSRALRGDLDAVVLKTLRKEPAQRYSTVGDLAADIQRYLDRRPVLARRGGWRYRAARFLRRHALAAVLAAIAVIGLVSGLGVALWQARIARSERDTARQSLAFMTHLFESADPGLRKKTELTVQDLLDEGTRTIRSELADQPSARLELLLAMATAYAGMELPDSVEPLLDEAERIAVSLNAVAHQAEILRLRCHVASSRNRTDDCAALLDRVEAMVNPEDPAQRRTLLQAIEMRSMYLSRQNRHAEVVKQMERALALTTSDREYLRRREELLGTLSYSLVKLGRAAEAVSRLRPLVEELRRTPDTPPRILADALDNLARSLAAQGHKDEAIALNAESLAVMEALYGPDNPIISVKLGNYAVTLYEAGQLTKALPLLKRVVALDRAGGEPRLRGLANSLGNLGALEFQLGNNAVARELLTEAVEVAVRAGVPLHQGGWLRWRGVLAMTEQRYADAQADLAESQKVLAPLFAPDHASLLRGRLLAQLARLGAQGWQAREAVCVAVSADAPKWVAAKITSAEASVAAWLQSLCAMAAPDATAVDASYRELVGRLPKEDYRLRYLEPVKVRLLRNAAP